MEYLIRDFQENDIHQLVELCANHAVYEKCDYEPANKEALLKNALLEDNAGLHCWVVVVQGKMVGYATFTFDFSTWEARYYLHLDCLYLEEKFRGFGIGEEIMRRLIVIARKEGCVNLQWQTPVFNGHAIRFYERIGGKGLEKKRFHVSI